MRVFLLLVLLLGCQTASVSRVPASSGGDLSFAKLREILDRHQFSTIKELLAHLQGNGYKNYLDFHTFGFHSKSLHGSSFENPRAIVYGETGEFIITFNNDPKHAAYEMLETVEFNREKKQFEFREIEFRGDKNGGRGFAISPVGGPVSSDFPQGKCLQCHTNSRPIWESYPAWPGFYGGQDDIYFSAKFKESKNNLPPYVSAKMRLALKNFFSRWRGTRYQFLGSAGGPSTYGTWVRPNGQLNVLIDRLNYERVVEILRKLPPLSQEKCAQLLSRNFLPEAQKIDLDYFSHIMGNADEVDRETREPADAAKEIANRKEFLAKNIQWVKMGNLHNDYPLDFAKMEFLYPEAQSRTWSAALFEGIYDFNDGAVNENADFHRATRLFIDAAERRCQNR